MYHAIALWIPTLGGTLAYARLRPRLIVIDQRDIAALRSDPAGMPTPSEDDVQSQPIAA